MWAETERRTARGADVLGGDTSANESILQVNRAQLDFRFVSLRNSVCIKTWKRAEKMLQLRQGLRRTFAGVQRQQERGQEGSCMGIWLLPILVRSYESSVASRAGAASTRRRASNPTVAGVSSSSSRAVPSIVTSVGAHATLRSRPASPSSSLTSSVRGLTARAVSTSRSRAAVSSRSAVVLRVRGRVVGGGAAGARRGTAGRAASRAKVGLRVRGDVTLIGESVLRMVQGKSARSASTPRHHELTLSSRARSWGFESKTTVMGQKLRAAPSTTVSTTATAGGFTDTLTQGATP